MSFKNHCFYLFCSIIVLVLGYCASKALSRPLDDRNVSSMRDRHEQWMAKYGRTYKDLDEKEKRFNIFQKNVEYIENFNRAAPSNNILYTLGVNIFADLTTEEFKATHTGSRPLTFPSGSKSSDFRATSFKHANITNMPPSLDWREEGAVTPIKDQGNCGCCWAFASVASVASVEGLQQTQSGKLISLSEQELNDCDTTNHGCEGGNIIKAFKFIEQNQGLLTEDTYPYKGVDGQCQTLQGDKVTIRAFENVPPNDETALLQAVSSQPVVVHVDSSGFHHYQGGIFNGDCGTNIDHDFTIIGYGTDDGGNNYWLVKNSWGTGWGEQGYMRIIRDKNMCGLVIRSPNYPI